MDVEHHGASSTTVSRVSKCLPRQREGRLPAVLVDALMVPWTLQCARVPEKADGFGMQGRQG